MCIRDRFKDVPAGNYEYKIALDKAWTENYGADGIPVSYTHLDVYKRQI